MDLNKDGILALEGFRKFQWEIAVSMFNRVDNADGKLTNAEVTKYYVQNWPAEEAEKRANRMIERYHANKNGVLTAAEYGMK